MLRRLCFSTLVVIAAAGPARADDPYPQIVVDRPLVLAPDMTEADAGVDFPTYLVGLSSHTRLGDYHDVGVSIHHAFGPVQIGIGFTDSPIGPLIEAGPRWYVGPGAIDIDLGIRIPNDATDIDHEYQQALRYTSKGIVVPHVLAVWGSAGLAADEYTYPYYGVPDVPMGDTRFAAVAGGGVEVQLVDELELSASFSAFVPVSDSMNTKASAAVGASVTYVFDRFDIYGGVSLGDLPSAELPYASMGVAARFGG